MPRLRRVHGSTLRGCSQRSRHLSDFCVLKTAAELIASGSGEGADAAERGDDDDGDGAAAAAMAVRTPSRPPPPISVDERDAAAQDLAAALALARPMAAEAAGALRDLSEDEVRDVAGLTATRAATRRLAASVATRRKRWCGVERR